MQSPFARIELDQPSAYGLVWRSATVAHIWWEQDADRREALGWYLRDLRAPGRVSRLDIDPSVDELARDRTRSATAWADDAERLRTLTLAFALGHAERLVGETLQAPAVTADTPANRLDVYVRDLDLELLALAFPDLPISVADDAQPTHVIHADLGPSALQNLLARIHALGGRVVAIMRIDDDPQR